MLTAGVIGCGYWGPNLIRNLDAIKDVKLKYIADLDPVNLAKMRDKYPYVLTVDDYTQLLKDEEVDMILIATPVTTHFRFAKEALEHGKHVFVEKPLTDSVESSKVLCSLADQKGLTLMTGHTFVYTGAVRKMKEIIDSGEIGDVLQVSSQRLNLGLFQRDTNVIWDLAPHDISIINYLMGDVELDKLDVEANCNIHPHYEDSAYLHLTYKNNVKANIHLSWLHPEKVRKFSVIGRNGMLVYDEVEPIEKVKLYRKSVVMQVNDRAHAQYEYYQDSGKAIDLDQKEALYVELKHFVECINTGMLSNSNGYEGLKIVKVLRLTDKLLKFKKEKKTTTLV
ncbi:Gfo/Idh/MocA family oxidoreductase [Radiobacillus kanasensis]|uniref:Gfo/Idh/MocA family protein n=1 Tax=Radiobacillus kanasensis TaxID=2844358 RepID=UPI001E5CF5C6|nr:Gfo/Idh/MocA family oxidoreductase [Radiobacillus kanasensis]UFT98852.1 Gfo/Idh/MocA family oxidoreductase [Radiobacillus kanasensis]